MFCLFTFMCNQASKFEGMEYLLLIINLIKLKLNLILVKILLKLEIINYGN